MLRKSGGTTKELVTQIIGLVRERLPERDAVQVEQFVRQYFSGTSVEDLIGRGVPNLYGAALSHWSLARTFNRGPAKIHVYNPNFERHGWQSTHTVVEIVSDDMPFLVDSVRMALNDRGLTVHLIIHPVMNVHRDSGGRMTDLSEPNSNNAAASTEAIMHFEVDRQTDKRMLEGIRSDVERVLADVRAAVEDWAAMREQVGACLHEWEQRPPPLPAEELAEARAFLQWLDEHHFTFLGYRQYALLEEEGEDVLRSVAGSGLGLLRDSGAGGVSESFAMLAPEVRKLARRPELLVITKSNTRATVHRPAYMDYVGVKRLSAEGDVIGERRFVGLYTSAAYNRVPRAIPLLRTKVANLLARAGYPATSHDGKALGNILDNLPRDELFQIPEEELYGTAMGILHLQERQHIRVFIHRETYGRYFSCLVYIPREQFNTEIRQRIRGILEATLQGDSSEFTVNLTEESILARVHFIVRIPSGTAVEYDVADIEAQIVEATRSWTDVFHSALVESLGEEEGARLFRRYGAAFRAGYRDGYSPRTAVNDAVKLESLSDENRLAMSLHRPLEAPEGMLRLKLYRPRFPIPLSEALPMLENMGLKVVDETPSKLKPADGDRLWIQDFGMEHGAAELDLDVIRDTFQDAFARIWHGDVENDGFNRLVLGAGLSWREIVVLRAYCKYLRQARFTFSQAYMEQALAANAHLARLLVRLFYVRFEPSAAKDRADVSARLTAEIEEGLDAVTSLDEDRILRGFLGMIQATLRTNYFQCQADGSPKPYLSFKLDPDQVPELPEPRPMFEIFVYSPRVEGVHLRGGKVARGGLRWSDRMEDFRTEILGLVKAQMVKNAVIVPMGAKGGFVCKALPASGEREAVMEEGIACYKTFVRGLLDITDNIVHGEVVAPRDVTRHDDDDPYLVVAADKGTASFSDIANAVASDYGFWLSDAFASGGSVGYDHKKMGITARGAWESVKRHFRELGLNTQTTDFTAVGIGDMSGDVFGNGTLLSEHIKLIGAFNHQHIFIDPDPDLALSYQERKRLFALPRSSWSDYDSKALSKGGGVYPRSAKSVVLSPEAQQALGVTESAMRPNDVIRALLRAPVDLLWNGGIGTYVKASDETDADVGDRANDAVRVDATDLRCRVVGEGGNLGVTQLGRVEFALKGGRIYTDAIDNSGGVDCSDHEVNIKILLNAIVADGDMTEKQRRKLLADMTDEVAELVLGNNYLQTQALSVTEGHAAAILDVHARLIRSLERDGLLDRSLEFLPNEEQIGERKSAQVGLCKPELAVLLAYSKISLVQRLLESDLAEDPFLERELELYFPTPLRDRFRKEMREHRLWREVICTQVANSLVNRAGISFMFRLADETGAAVPDIARAYMVAREVFGMERLWADIEALDNQVPAHIQLAMLAEGRRLISRATRWLLANRPRPLAIAETVDYFSSGVAGLVQSLAHVSAPSDVAARYSAAECYTVAGVPSDLADRVVGFDALFSGLDLVDVATVTQRAVQDVATVYFRLSERLELNWIGEQIAALSRENRWQTLARAALRDEFYIQWRGLTGDALRNASETDADLIITAWLERDTPAVNRWLQVVTELKAGAATDFAMLSVAMREIRSLRQLELPQEAEMQADAPPQSKVHKGRVG